MSVLFKFGTKLPFWKNGATVRLIMLPGAVQFAAELGGVLFVRFSTLTLNMFVRLTASVRLKFLYGRPFKEIIVIVSL